MTAFFGVGFKCEEGEHWQEQERGVCEEGFEEGTMPNESDSSDKTRQGEQGERERIRALYRKDIKDSGRKPKLSDQCGEASKEDDDEPNGEEATEKSSFSNNPAGSDLGNIY